LIASGSEDKSIIIWDSESSKEIAACYLDAPVHSISISPDGSKIACGDDFGNFKIFKLIGFGIGSPVVTCVRLWLFSSYKDKIEWVSNTTSNWNVEQIKINYLNENWDNYPTVICPYCGLRFPCTIPNNATRDDPRLLSNCPECGEKLKFNPFVVDNIGRGD
jgi:WD40 repeat protein